MGLLICVAYKKLLLVNFGKLMYMYNVASQRYGFIIFVFWSTLNVLKKQNVPGNRDFFSQKMCIIISRSENKKNIHLYIHVHVPIYIHVRRYKKVLPSRYTLFIYNHFSIFI